MCGSEGCGALQGSTWAHTLQRFWLVGWWQQRDVAGRRTLCRVYGKEWLGACVEQGVCLWVEVQGASEAWKDCS
jgi:hypothetical protein